MLILDDEREAIEGIVKDSLKDVLAETKIAEAAEKLATPERITKEEILAVKDRATRQKLIAENMDLFV